MKVRDLIAELAKLNPEALVMVDLAYGSDNGTVKGIHAYDGARYHLGESLGDGPYVRLSVLPAHVEGDE